MRKPLLKVAFLGVLTMFATLFGFWFLKGGNDSTLPGSIHKAVKGLSSKSGAKPFTFLFLGCDIGGFKGNTDAIMLVRVEPEASRISVMSVPRDTRVQIPKHGYHKLNAANQIGGPALTTKLVEEITGAKVDFYALVDFEGFKELIDALGGIEIDVERNMFKVDPYQNLRINLKKGRQRLNGEQAMGYVRFRDDTFGDITRVERQQKFFKALLNRVKEPDAFNNLPALVRQSLRTVRTNISLGTALTLLDNEYRTIDWQVVSATAPGWFMDAPGPDGEGIVSYWAVNPAKVKKAWADLQKGIEHRVFDEEIQATIPVTKPKQSDKANSGQGVRDSVYGKVYLEQGKPQNPDGSNMNAGHPSETEVPTKSELPVNEQPDTNNEANNPPHDPPPAEDIPDWLAPASTP